MLQYSLLTFGLIIGLVFVFFKTNGQEAPAINSQSSASYNISTQEDSLIFEMIKDYPDQSEVSIALVRNGTVRFYGVKRDDDQIKSIENQGSIFEIGSISKVFTSTILSHMVGNGTVDHKDFVANHYDFPFKDSSAFTFEQLANHTAGLPRLPSNIGMALFGSNPYAKYDGEKLEEYLKNKVKVSKQKGLKSDYSNLGAGLLGYTLGKIDGSDYETILKKYVTTRLEMSSTTAKRENVKGDLVKGLDAKGNITSNWDFEALAGGGAILSSVEDLSLFAQDQWNDESLVNALTQKETFKMNDRMSMGLGWHIITTKDGRKVLFHNGGTGGYTSHMTVDTENRLAVIILSNVSAFHYKMSNIDDLGFGLMKILIGVN